MKNYITLLWLIIPQTMVAYSNPVVSGWNGNIYFSISPPNGPGASEKAWLIVEQAARYCEEIKFKGRIYLDFDYLQTSLSSDKDIETEYFLGYSYKRKGRLNILDDYWPFQPLRNGLIISARGKKFSSKKILQLLAFSIENITVTKQYGKDGHKIPQSILDSIFLSPLNNFARDIYESEISTQSKNSQPSVFLTIKEDSFYVKVNRWNSSDTLILVLPDIFALKPNHEGAFIFDTDSTFQYLGNRGNCELSSKHQVEKISPYLSGPIIENLNHQVYIIHYSGSFFDFENPPLKIIKKKMYLFKLHEDRIIDISISIKTRF